MRTDPIDRRSRWRTAIAVVMMTTLLATLAAGGIGLHGAQLPQKSETMKMHAKGTFDVKLAPDGQEDKADGTSMGRMSIDKMFHGDLQGSSTGQMLTGMTDVKGSAGYVAIERVTGTLQGKKGSFILQHNGLMDRGAPVLTITVVPDSGSGELAGVRGTMTIAITDGKHFYDLAYTLPAAR